MMYRAWLRLQLGFWLAVGWFEKQYGLFQARRLVKSLEDKGLLYVIGKGKDGQIHFTELGLAVREELMKTTVRPEDVR